MAKESKFRLFSKLAAAALIVCAAGLLWHTTSQAESQATTIPAPATDDAKTGSELKTAVIAGGCFWGMQGVFQHVKGVRAVLAGYSGGEKETADYRSVSTGDTGHAESIKIVYDPRDISFGELLQVYFSVAHDPTELDRQGPDSGSEYRSAIFFADASQQQLAKAYIDQLNKAQVFHSAIVTRLDPLKGFYPAEAYHQDFLIRNPGYPYIVYNDLPKIENLKRLFPEFYQEKVAPSSLPRSSS